MKNRLARLKFYLLVLLGLAWGGWGCHTDANQKKAPKTGYSALRLHLEVNADGTDKNGTVMVGRLTPFPVNVNKVAFIENLHLLRVSLAEDGMGGFGLRIQLNQKGSWILEQCTIANKGRRIAVFAELDGFHWIAAPLITRRISDGVFTFTPDASREEAEKLVLGMTKEIKRLRGQTTLNDPDPK